MDGRTIWRGGPTDSGDLHFNTDDKARISLDEARISPDEARINLHKARISLVGYMILPRSVKILYLSGLYFNFQLTECIININFWRYLTRDVAMDIEFLPVASL